MSGTKEQTEGLISLVCETAEISGSNVLNSLEGIDVESIQDRALCYVRATDTIYRFFEDSTATPSPPSVILPVKISALDPGRWILDSSSSEGDPSFVFDTTEDLRAAPVLLEDAVYTTRGTTQEGIGGGTWLYESGAAPGTYSDNTGTIVLPSGGDGSSAFLRQYDGSVWCEWYGAYPGASAAVNVSTIQATIESAKTLGKNAEIGPGEFDINETIEISDASGLYFTGAGDNSGITDATTTFSWSGDTSSPAIRVQDSRACKLSQFEISATISAPLYCGVQLWWSGSGAVQFRIELERIAVRGNGGYVGYGFRVEKDAAAPDFNNSEHVFYACGATEFGDGGGLFTDPSGFVVLQTQAKALLFIRCGALGNVASASYGYYGLGACYWIGGGISYVNESAFFLTGPNDVTAVHGLQSEGCAALLKTANTSSAGVVDITDIRFANDEMQAPYTLIEYKWGGIMKLGDSRIGGTILPMKIILDQFVSVSAEVTNCYIGLTSTEGVDMFTFVNPGEKRVESVRNVRTAGGGISGLLTDYVTRETTPSGPTASRTPSPQLGSCYLDTDLGKPIWFDGTNWREADGTLA